MKPFHKSQSVSIKVGNSKYCFRRMFNCSLFDGCVAMGDERAAVGYAGARPKNSPTDRVIKFNAPPLFCSGIMCS